MAEIPTCEWIGASETRYKYYIYRLPASFDPDQLGNYIYTKKSPEGKWIAIYIGEGDLNDRANYHHQIACIKRKGATHFHCHKNAVEGNRLAEEEDLLKHYTYAYTPTGCNERRGG